MAYTTDEFRVGKQQICDNYRSWDGVRSICMGNTDDEIDHIIELQIIVAALSTIADYSRDNWKNELKKVVNCGVNLQRLSAEENKTKTYCIGQWLAEWRKTSGKISAEGYLTKNVRANCKWWTQMKKAWKEDQEKDGRKDSVKIALITAGFTRLANAIEKMFYG